MSIVELVSLMSCINGSCSDEVGVDSASQTPSGNVASGNAALTLLVDGASWSLSGNVASTEVGNGGIAPSCNMDCVLSSFHTGSSVVGMASCGSPSKTLSR
jgi:hypothetical protein